MKNSKTIPLYISFILGFIISVGFVFFNILDKPFGLLITLVGVVATIVFIVLSIIEIASSRNIKTTEKIMWYIGLIFLVNLVGIIYLIIRKNHILKSIENNGN